MPITASDSSQGTASESENDGGHDGQVDGDCEELDPDEVQEVTLSDWDALRAEEEAAAKYHEDQGRQAWAAVSRRVLEICSDYDDVAVFMAMPPQRWPSDDLTYAFAEVANAMPAKWRAGSLWVIQSAVRADPDDEDYCLQSYAKVMAAVGDLAARLDDDLVAYQADLREVANG